MVQASAADWALVLLVCLRRRLGDVADAELVFFQHDEVVVHCPADRADQVTAMVEASAREATALLFGPTRVSFPMTSAVVRCYAEAK